MSIWRNSATITYCLVNNLHAYFIENLSIQIQWCFHLEKPYTKYRGRGRTRKPSILYFIGPGGFKSFLPKEPEACRALGAYPIMITFTAELCLHAWLGLDIKWDRKLSYIAGHTSIRVRRTCSNGYLYIDTVPSMAFRGEGNKQSIYFLLLFSCMFLN